MAERVAIVGIGETPYLAENREQHITEMVYEAVRKWTGSGLDILHFAFGLRTSGRIGKIQNVKCQDLIAII